MGYRSDIRIVMKKKDYPKFSKYVEDYIAEKQAQYNLMEHIDVKEEGTQVSDIAPKIDYNDKVVKAPIAGLKESVILRGFLKNEKGQYQRGNYILCKENDKFVSYKTNWTKGNYTGQDYQSFAEQMNKIGYELKIRTIWYWRAYSILKIRETKSKKILRK